MSQPGLTRAVMAAGVLLATTCSGLPGAEPTRTRMIRCEGPAMILTSA